MTDLKKILYDIGYTKLKDTGKEWSTRPLYRDSDNDTALSINKQTGEFYDFVDRIGGPIELLIEKTLGQSQSSDLISKISSKEFLPSRKEEVELPYQKVFNKELLLKLIPNHSYWISRGISEYTLGKFNGGLAVDGKMRNRYVFPVFDERSNVVGFSGRYLYDYDNIVRWKHLGAKTNWIYPISSFPVIYNSKQVILVESIGDMLTLYDAGIKNVLVMFGVNLSVSIIKFLLQVDPKDIIVSLNNDIKKKSVGNKAAEEFYSTLKSYFDPSQVKIVLPTKKDFGEMSKDEILIWKQENKI